MCGHVNTEFLPDLHQSAISIEVLFIILKTLYPNAIIRTCITIPILSLYFEIIIAGKRVTPLEKGKQIDSQFCFVNLWHVIFEGISQIQNKF